MHPPEAYHTMLLPPLIFALLIGYGNGETFPLIAGEIVTREIFPLIAGEIVTREGTFGEIRSPINMGIFQANPYFLQTSSVTSSAQPRWIFYAGPPDSLTWISAPVGTPGWEIGDRGNYVTTCPQGMWWRCFRANSAVHARTRPTLIEHKQPSADQPTCHCSVCPEGMVCPDGIHANVCPAGTYSNIKSSVSNGYYRTCAACPIGSYCPQTPRMTEVQNAKVACMATFMRDFNLNDMITNTFLTNPLFWNNDCDTYFNVENNMTYVTGLSATPTLCPAHTESYISSAQVRLPFGATECRSQCLSIYTSTVRNDFISLKTYLGLKHPTLNVYEMAIILFTQTFPPEVFRETSRYRVGEYVNYSLSDTPMINPTECILCPLGNYAVSHVCTACPLHHFNNDVVNANPSTKGRCVICPPEEYTSAVGSTACIINTIIGKYVSNNMLLSCPPYKKAVSGTKPLQMGCAECEPRMMAQIVNGLSSTGCEYCGTAMVRAAGNEACSFCGRGSYYYTGEVFNNTCKTCASGTYSSGGAAITQCKSCPNIFTYIDQQQTNCDSLCLNKRQRCRNGNIANGDVVNVDTRTTSVCHASGQACGCFMLGMYMQSEDPKECVECPPGSYCDGTNEQKIGCPIGRYSVRNGTSRSDQCSVCDIGTYTDTEGQSVCLQCKPGHRCPGINFVGSYGLMVPCTVGNYQPNASMSVCIPCEAGTYQNSTHATSCKICHGSTAPAATNCTPCVELTTFYNGSGLCNPCTNSGGAGKKVLTLCTASKKNGDTTFTHCLNSCPTVGDYLSGPVCPGNTTHETRTCVRCALSCGEGSYQARLCDNTVGTNRVCATCNRTSCGSMQYRSRFCNGNDTSDVSACTDCTTDCRAGMYKYTSNCGPHSTEDNACLPCRVLCGYNEYISGVCYGNSTSDSSVCVPCRTRCANGAYMSGICDGSQHTDITCVPCETQDSCDARALLTGGNVKLWMHLPPSKCYGNGTVGSVCTECYNSSCAAGYFTQSTCQAVGANVATDDCVMCTTQCQPGQKLDVATQCSTGKEKSTTQCSACTSNCGTNYYLSTPCSGATYHDSTECTACRYCPRFTYQKTRCDGRTNKDVTACMECTVREECPARQMVIGKCTGRGGSNSASCVTCGMQCSGTSLTNASLDSEVFFPGQYIPQSSIMSCVAGVFKPQSCQNCTACPDFEYASVPCDGRTTHNTVCTPCRMQCQEKQYMDNLCLASLHPTDVDPNADRCMPCKACDIGKFQLKVCSAGGIVSNHSGDRICADCTKVTDCADGQYLAGNCDPLEKFGPKCVNCVICNPGQRRIENCTSTTPGLCVADPACFEDCPKGFYRVSGCTDGNLPICKRCSGCLQGQFIQVACTQNDIFDDQCAPCKLLCNGEYNAQYGSCPGNLMEDTIGCSVDNYTIGDQCAVNTYQVGYSDFNKDVSSALVQLPGFIPIIGLSGTRQQLVLGVSPQSSMPYYAVAWSNRVLVFDMTSHNMSAAPIYSANRPSNSQVGSVTFSHEGNYVFLTDGRQEGGQAAGEASTNIWKCGPIVTMGQHQCTLYVAGNLSLIGSNDIPPVSGCARATAPYLICTFGGYSETQGREISRILRVDAVTGGHDFLYDANDVSANVNDVIRFVSPPVVDVVSVLNTRLYVMTSSRINNVQYAYQLWLYNFNSTWGLTSSVVLSSKSDPFTNNRFLSLVMRADTGAIIAYGSRMNSDHLYVFQSPLYAVGRVNMVTQTSGDLSWENMWFSMQTSSAPGKPTKLYIADSNKQAVYQYTHCVPCPPRSSSSYGSIGLKSCQCNPGTYSQIGAKGIGSCIQCNNNQYSCGVGQYHVVGGSCSGFTSYDTTCAPCKVKCGTGQHLQGICDGTGNTDTVSCTACRTSCDSFLGTSCAIDCASSHSMWYQFNAYKHNISDSSVHLRHLVNVSTRGFPDAVKMDYTDYKTDGASVYFVNEALGYLKVKFPNDPLLSLNLAKYPAWTIAAWVKTYASGGPVITCGNEIGWAALRMWVSGTHVTLMVRSDIPSSVTRQLVQSRGTIASSGWQHVAVQIDGMIWRIFLDGVQSLPGQSLGMPTGIGDGILDLPHLPNVYFHNCAIGKDVTQTIQGYYTGHLDDVRVVHRAMTLPQIAAIVSGDRCCSSASGYHLDNSVQCGGGAAYDQVQCVPCKVDCGQGRYVNNENNRCNGRASIDEMYCDECKSCSPGTYMRSSCTGNTFSDEVQCSPCQKNTTNDCPVGQLLVNACSGFSVSDTAYCKPCDILADYFTEGWYIVGNSTPGMPCLNGRKDYVANVCDSKCSAGFFISKTCTGLSFSNIVCSPCNVQCKTGQYISGQCDGTSTTDTSTCVQCASCGSGKFQSSTCDGTGYSDLVAVVGTCQQCDSVCAAGFYLRGDCVSVIRLCTQCSPACSTGFYESVPCTAITNRVCVPRITCSEQCPSGTYQTEACTLVDYSPKFCSLCTTCPVGQYMVHACSQDSNTVCALCKTMCPLLDGSNSMTGTCSGTSAWDSVVCYNSTTPLAGITAPGEYVTASMVLMRAASKVLTVDVQSMDVSPDGVFHMRWYAARAGVLDARLIIDVEIYYVNDVNNLRYASFSTKSFSSVMLEPLRSLSSLRSNFPAVAANSSNGLVNISTSSLAIDQVLWASGTSRLLFTTQQVIGWIGYCWVTSGYIDIRSCGTLHSTPAYNDASFSVITANQGCARSWVPNVLLCLYLHQNTTHVYRIDETGGIDSRIRMTSLSYMYSAQSFPAVHLGGHRMFVLGQHSTNGVTQLFSFIFSDIATLVDPVTILFSGYLTSGWIGYVENPAQIIVRQNSNTTSVLVGPSFNRATSLSLDTNTAVFTVGSKVLVAVHGGTYLYSFAALCPTGSTSPPGAIGIASCVCGNGTYGIITNSESTCKKCASEQCKVGQYRTLNFCGGAQAKDSSCAPCTTICPAGNYVKNACTGYSTNSTAICAPCGKSCPSTTYADSTACTGLTLTDPTACIACKTTCTQGFFIQGSCNGQQSYDITRCVPCTQCLTGSYKTQSCTGATNVDVTCAPCAQTSCATGMVLVDACTGDRSFDNSTCLPKLTCDYQCTFGSYIAKECNATLGNKSFACSACENDCGTDKYKSGPCYGNTFFRLGCAPCTATCKNGEYLAGRCTGTGYTDTSSCSKCTDCAEGYFRSKPCDGTTTYEPPCSPCVTKCASGEYIVGKCTQTTTTGCTLCSQICEAGMYLKTNSHAACNGERTVDTVICELCRSCSRGFYRSKLNQCNGLTKDDPVECIPCRVTCAAGYYLSGECMGESATDTTACVPCTSCPSNPHSGYNSIVGVCLGQSNADTIGCSYSYTAPYEQCQLNHFLVNQHTVVTGTTQQWQNVVINPSSAANAMVYTLYGGAARIYTFAVSELLTMQNALVASDLISAFSPLATQVIHYNKTQWDDTGVHLYFVGRSDSKPALFRYRTENRAFDAVIFTPPATGCDMLDIIACASIMIHANTATTSMKCLVTRRTPPFIAWVRISIAATAASGTSCSVEASYSTTELEVAAFTYASPTLQFFSVRSSAVAQVVMLQNNIFTTLQGSASNLFVSLAMWNDVGLMALDDGATQTVSWWSAPFSNVPRIIFNPMLSPLTRATQLLVFSRNRLMFVTSAGVTLYTHCAPCPPNSVYNASVPFGQIQCSCVAGFYGKLHHANSLCSKCRGTNEQCSYGQYKTQNTCSVSGLTSDVSCAACASTCADGTLKRGEPCTGVTHTDTVVCEDCGYCKPGTFLNGGCQINSEASICSPCSTSCPTGQYVDVSKCGVSNPKLDSACNICTLCPTGKYQSGLKCSGFQQNDTHVCSTCASMNCTARYGPAYWKNSSACVSTQSLDPEVLCQRCALDTCPPGYFFTAACSAERDVVCTKCSTMTCNAGHYRTSCNSTHDSVCVPCQQCQQGVSYACTTPQFITSGQCTLCDGVTDRVCRSCSTQCVAGEQILVPCTVEHDVTCGILGSSSSSSSHSSSSSSSSSSHSSSSSSSSHSSSSSSSSMILGSYGATMQLNSIFPNKRFLYYGGNSQTDFYNASARCQSNGMQLATVWTHLEMMAIHDWNKNVGNAAFWIGLVNNSWTDGARATYRLNSNKTVYPNGCVYVSSSTSEPRWLPNSACSIPRMYLCEQCTRPTLNLSDNCQFCTRDGTILNIQTGLCEIASSSSSSSHSSSSSSSSHSSSSSSSSHSSSSSSSSSHSSSSSSSSHSSSSSSSSHSSSSSSSSHSSSSSSSSHSSSSSSSSQVVPPGECPPISFNT